ncbi:H+ transporting pump, P-type ATPase [Paracholeplasma brassicae]|uniref:H+ transporting pump, P-type ATPase n=1 Tax=Acholeplasma brassicae TaxID=61635 RepID=U4KMH9_9MOLU|nr:HAD-IC family P-type ATPase [Paracholeplasma brassicae]CCV65315.1 H+ transporting pump, P-type ATPase [Paracholeplasma brassicae]
MSKEDDLKQEVKQLKRETDINAGLSTLDVEKRITDGLVNRTNQGSTKTIKSIILSNLITFFNLLNFAIAGWLLSVGAYKDIVFMAIVSANITIGIIQEIKAKKTIDKLSLLSAPTAVVLRDSELQEIMISDLVMDDILKLSVGKQISADGIVRSGSIEVNESLLTGESDPIIKRPGDELFSGSFVVSGNCLAQVSAVGKDVFVEKLTKQAKKYKRPKSDLLKSLKLVITVVAIIILPIGFSLFYMQMNNLDGQAHLYEQVVRGTAGAMIGMIPSGLFLLTSVTLAVGVLRLAQNNTLVQELYCIEMLARVDTLCLDKTGTITDGTMSVKNTIEYVNPSGMQVKRAISVILATLEDKNLTSEALEEKFGIAQKKIKTNAIIPFSSSRKFSAVEFDKYGTFALGAPEFVLKKEALDKISDDVDKNAKEGYRVLVLAHSKDPIDKDKAPNNLEAIALIVIEDTIRPDAILTIEYFKNHGVDVKVISGDNPMTVSHISKRAGIVDAERYISLDGLSDKEVAKIADKYTVFGRVSPSQKKILVQSLKSSGRTVAMTGDGVNDILALKEADTSIAMASGSEAARNVSHLVLLDSNFSSMPKVVSEGRRVINNVQRVAVLFLTKTIFSFMLAMIALLSKGSYPITPSQLFMIDFLVIGIPSFILALEPNNNLVKGKFLFNVLRRALPGAIVVTLNTVIIFNMKKLIAMTDQQASTIIVICATFTSMMVLYRVLRPFNGLRRLLFAIMFTIFVVAVIVFPGFFEFNSLWQDYYNQDTGALVPRLPIAHLLLMIVLIQASLPLMSIVSSIPSMIRKGVRFILIKLSNI